jgi:hypothetical protein
MYLLLLNLYSRQNFVALLTYDNFTLLNNKNIVKRYSHCKFQHSILISVSRKNTGLSQACHKQRKIYNNWRTFQDVKEKKNITHGHCCRTQNKEFRFFIGKQRPIKLAGMKCLRATIKPLHRVPYKDI